MKKADWIILAILSASSALFPVNFLLTRSALVGTVASLLFLGSASTILGKMVFKCENLFFRTFLGVTTLFMILALTGTILVICGVFTEAFSLIALIVVAVSLVAALIIAGRKKPANDSAPAVLKSDGRKNYGTNIYFSFVFVFSAVIAFGLLLQSRTWEGGSSVWVTIPSSFILVYLIGALCLVVGVFFTDLHTSLKLAFISVFSFLSHSLFLLVWYPGRYGDPWVHLGEVRFIARTGMPYAYEWTLQKSLWFDLLKSKSFYSLIVFFNRMLFVDIYWVFIAFIPVIWSVFSPLLAYKITETLAIKRSKTFALLAAMATLIFPSLVLWGAVSVSYSFGLIFLFVSLALLLAWMRQGGRRIWLAAFLAVIVSSLAHPQAGIFAFVFLFFGTIVQKTSRKLFYLAGFLLMLALYPLALYIQGARISLAGLLQVGNLVDVQSEIFSFLFVFALVGLILGIRSRFVNPKTTRLLFVFLVVVLFEFYFTKFGMINMPFNAERSLVISDFLLALLAPLGFATLIGSLNKRYSQGKRVISSSLSSAKRVRVTPRVIGLILIGLFLSIQTTTTLYQAFPQEEIQKVQPSAYELDAIQYIDDTAPHHIDGAPDYVVLCDPSFAALASGFLGADYSYRVYGNPEWEYPTIQMYVSMTQQPSVGYMQAAMDFVHAPVCYFVVSVRDPSFEQVVSRTSEFLPVNNVFGDGKLYIFKYPGIPVEKTGPEVTVVFDDGETSANVATELNYLVESEINATLTVWGHASYNVSEFPDYWAFVDLTINDQPGRFDNSSDVYTFIYIKGLQLEDTVVLRWLFYPKYPRVGWKENSFKRDWHPSTTYPGIPGKPPSVTVNGSVFSISYSFESGIYWYSYYVTSVGTSTNDYPYLMIRWRCVPPVAVAYAYFEDGTGQEIISFGSQSPNWITTIVKLRSGATLSEVMVGLTNAVSRQLSGDGTLEIGFIIIAGEAI
jgi:hypothetical protein